MRKKIYAWMLAVASCLLWGCAAEAPFFKMRGVVLATEDLETVDWPRLAHENGINTIGTHITPEQVLAFWDTDKGKQFRDGCKKYGIKVEHELHAMKSLLPRNLYMQDSTMFRMDEKGRRVADFNCCPSSSRALDTIAAKALYYARKLPSTNHRYYYWLDDGAPVCRCASCSQYTPSEQALIIENHIIKALRTWDRKAMLAHLAYVSSLEAPRKVKPAEGIFLEFAPFIRVMNRALTDTTVVKEGKVNAHNLRCLRDNLEVFPVETAVVLDYWLDVSMASLWKKPAVKLPWHPEVFKADVETYAKLGIRNVTSFAVYMDSEYFKNYPLTDDIRDYGQTLKTYRPKK